MPVERFHFFNTSGRETITRPGEDPFLGTGGGSYISSDMINDFERPEGYEDDVDFVGVLVNILPGPLSPFFTQVDHRTQAQTLGAQQATAPTR